MERSLRPGPWGYVIYAVSCSVFLIGFGVIHLTGTRMFPETLVFVGVIYVALAGGLFRTRIRVGNESIEFRPNFGYSKKVKYEVIAYARVHSIQTFGRRVRPFSLDIFVPGRQHPAITILIVSFRPEDTSWLLSLPQLRIADGH